jgi:hypothetical protein
MNKKQIIQIVVIVGAFAAAGVVLYNGGLFGSSPQAALTQNAPVVAQSQQEILPFGPTLDFKSVIDPKRFNYNQVIFPQVSSQTGIGVSVDNLIVSPLSK